MTRVQNRGAFDVSEPDVFSLYRNHIHENGGTESPKLDEIISLYFYRGCRLSQNSTLKISGPLVGAFDVSEPASYKII